MLFVHEISKGKTKIKTILKHLPAGLGMMGVPGGPPPGGGPCKHTDSAYSNDQSVLPKVT